MAQIAAAQSTASTQPKHEAAKEIEELIESQIDETWLGLNPAEPTARDYAQDIIDTLCRVYGLRPTPEMVHFQD